MLRNQLSTFLLCCSMQGLLAQSSGTRNPDGSVSYVSGSGSLTIEAKNPDNAYREAVKAVNKHSAHTQGYNFTEGQKAATKTISMTVTTDPSQVGELLEELSGLGEVKEKRYSEQKQVGIPPEVIEADLKALREKYDALAGRGKPDMESLRMLMGQISDKEGRLRSARGSSNRFENYASLYITINGKGFAEAMAEAREKQMKMEARARAVMNGKLEELGFWEKYQTAACVHVAVVSLLVFGGLGWWIGLRKGRAV